MPWSSEGDNVSFSGPLADLMGIIMTAYDQDVASGVCDVSAGLYVTAAAVVLREVVLESLEGHAEAAEFIEFIEGTLNEEDDGTVQISTLPMLDRIAEHIDTAALEGWMGSSAVRDAIAELSTTAFS
jgi:hypothetical protein